MTTPADAHWTEWHLEFGYQGRWHVSAVLETRTEGVTALNRSRTGLGTGQELRLVRVDTSLVRTVEAAVVSPEINGTAS